MPTRKLDLRDRLQYAMELVGATPADLAKACHISRAAVSKWMRGGAGNLKNEHLFAVAEYCSVDPKWLGTGKGAARSPRPLSGMPTDPRFALLNGLPELALRVARKWQGLDEPARGQVLMLIETLGALQSENYRTWGAEQRRITKGRRTKET